MAKKATPAPVAVEVQAAPFAPPNVEKRDADPPPYEFREEVAGVNAVEVVVQLLAQLGHPDPSLQLVVDATSTRGFGAYRFRYGLPADAVAEGAAASCCNGVLHVRVPRRAPRKVTVPVSDSIDDIDTPTTVPGGASDEAIAEVSRHSDAQPQQQQPPAHVDLVHIKAAGYTARQVRMEASPGILRVELLKGEGDQGRDGQEQEQSVEKLVLLPNELDLDTLRASCVDGLLVVRVAAGAPEDKERVVHVAPERVAAEPDAPLQAAGSN